MGFNLIETRYKKIFENPITITKMDDQVDFSINKTKSKRKTFKKLAPKRFRGGRIFEKNLKDKYGKSIIQDFNRFWNINNETYLINFVNKYGFSKGKINQIFYKLFRVRFYMLIDRQIKHYKRSFKTSYPVKYDEYTKELTIDEKCQAGKLGFLQIVCTYCNRYFYPSKYFVKDRIKALNKSSSSESRLYCSSNCFKSCPKYRTRWSSKPKSFKINTSREVQPELRQMVLERDDYECQKCGLTIDEAELHCHHIEGIEQNPIESADIDLCITFCKDCHMEAHEQEGCKYFQLRKKDSCS